MKRKILSAAVFMLAVCLVTVTAAAASYTVTDSTSALKYLQSTDSSNFIIVQKSFSIDSNISIGKGTNLESESGSITVTGGASVYNEGRISSPSLLLSPNSSITNHGYLELRSIPVGSTVDNYGQMVSPNGLSINGTLILNRGSSFSFSRNSVTNASAVINMSLGSRFVNETSGRYCIVLPDDTKIYLQGSFDYTVRKAVVPTITLSSPDAQGRCLLTITGNSANTSIYYTLDGSDPTSRSLVYTGPVYVASDVEVKAAARAHNSMFSDIVTVSASSGAASTPAPVEPPSAEEPSAQTFVKTPSPKASPSAGTYTYRQVISLSCPGAKIYYTTDGSTPTTESTLYTKSFDLVRSTTVKAVAVQPGKEPSDVVSFKYNLTGFNLTSTDFSDYAQLEKFWQPVISKISSSSGNVVFDSGSCPYLSNSVMEALHQKGSVSLTVRRTDGSSVVIPAGKALTDYQDNVRVWYSLDDLAQKFK